MYEVSIETVFSAAHLLRDYGGKCEELHGHNWKIQITVSSPRPDDKGLVIDFKKLRDITDRFIERFDHVNLNELPEFKNENPTTENIARVIFEGLEEAINGQFLRIKEVLVRETEGSWASFWK